MGSSNKISIKGASGNLIFAEKIPGNGGLFEFQARLKVTKIPIGYLQPAFSVGIYGMPIVEASLLDNILASINMSSATNKTEADKSQMALYVGNGNTASTPHNKIQGVLASVSIRNACFDAYAVQGHLQLVDNSGHSISTHDSGAHLTGGSFKANIAAGLTVVQGTVSAIAGILSGPGSVTQGCYNIWLYTYDTVTACKGFIRMDSNGATIPYTFSFGNLGADTSGHVFADVHAMTLTETSHAIRVEMGNGVTGFIPVFDKHDWT